VAAVLMAVLTIALQVAGAQPASAQTPAPATLSYEQFISLDAPARRERLAQMTPDRIATLKRVHADRWFAVHGSRLSSVQVAVFSEAREFITSARSVDPGDAEVQKREAALRYKLTCVLGDENTRQAFVLHLPDPAGRPGWRDAADAWLSWFFECVAP
jgi:hypothetical protein